MKVFLTGATGLAGAHTAIELLKHGYSLRMLVRNVAAAEQWFAKQGYENLDFVQGDMLDAACVEQAMQGCDAVIHAAAVIDLEAKNKQATEAKNLQGVENVIGAACKLGMKRIIYVSSITVIFSSEVTLLTEDREPTESQDPYTNSKVRCELRVRALQEQGYPVTISYPSAILGPDDPKLSQSNEGLMLLYRDFVPNTSSGMQIIDARDLAIAHRLMLEAPLESDLCQQRYIVGGHFLNWKQFAAVAQAAGGDKVSSIYLPAKLFRGLGLLFDLIRKVIPISYPISYEAAVMVTKMPECDSSKLVSKTGITFRPIEETFTDTLAWLKQAGHLTK